MTTAPADSAFDAALSDLEDWLLPNPFLSAPEPECRFVLDEEAFLAAIAADGEAGEPPPLFLQAPGEDYLRAVLIDERKSR